MSTPCGASRAAASSTAVLDEPARRLPEMARMCTTQGIPRGVLADRAASSYCNGVPRALVRPGPLARLRVVLLAAPGARAPAAPPPLTLLLRVVGSATRRPLPTAEVSAAARRGLTDAAGEVRIVWPSDGTLRVR